MHGPTAVREAVLTAPAGPAQRRMARLVAVFVGAGLLFYLVVQWGRAIEQGTWSALWYTPLVIGVSVVGGLLLIGGAVTSRMALVRAGAWVVVVGFPLYHLLWLPAWSGRELIDMLDYPWTFDFVALAPMAAILLVRGRVLVIYHLVLTSSIQFLPLPYRTGAEPLDVLLGVSVSVVFGGVFVLGTYSLYRSGARADAEAVHAEESVARTAGASAMALERERLDALIHDDVLGTLLAVTRTGNSAVVAEHARRAIDRIDAAGTTTSEELLVSPAFVGLLRGAIGTIDARVDLEVGRFVDGVTAPSSVAGDLAAATMEAVRNAMLHSGDGEPRVFVDLVEAGRRRGHVAVGVAIRVVDDGEGFDLRSVPPHRLGVRGSILGRINALDGGRARIDSQPGRGTVVHIGWMP